MDQGLLAAIILIALVAVDFVIRVISLATIPRNRRPQTAMAWLLAIFFLPFIGALVFLLIGDYRLPKQRRERQAEINDYIRETTEGIDQVSRDAVWPSWLESIVALNRELGSMPLVGGNDAKLYWNNDKALAAMTKAIRASTTTVHAEFYILSLDEATADFFDALEEAVARGVTVRVLLDHLGNIKYPGYRRTKTRLTAMGAQWHLMLPVQPLRGKFQRPDLRNHRKILVVDGELAFTGSQNIIETGYQRRGNHTRGLHWKDFMVKFRGPVVAAIDALFVTDWYSETGELLTREVPAARAVKNGFTDCQVVPSGPGFEGENNLRMFNSLVYAATRKVILTSPYFVPDDSMLYAITTAAQSGLDVQLFVSEIGDQFFVYHAQRSYYEALLKAGVKIYLYKTPTILHAKHLSIDDEVCVIGSSNMDMRSFTLDLEISVMIRDRGFTERLRAVEDQNRIDSRELTLDEWMARPRFSRALDNIARLTAAVQ